ncbi:MAG: hypothetical protein IVW52_04990 [Acidimicrobiales bacterium]|nr:hypothetical protein [Acidimicrobiales bacterium]
MSSNLDTPEASLIAESYLWHGTATHGYGGKGVPDDYLFPMLPAGRLYYLESAEIVDTVPVAVPWKQGSFVYDKVINQAIPEAWTPNLDGLVNAGVSAGRTGTIYGGGGPTSSPPAGSPVERWTAWTQPIPVTPSIQAQYGGSLAVGSSAEITLRLRRGPDAAEVRFTDSVKKSTGFELTSNPVPDGEEWLVCSAFIKADKAYTGEISRSSDGLVLASHAAALGATQSTGGYSHSQPSHALGGSYITWPQYVRLKATDSVKVVASADVDATYGFLVMAAEIAA